MIIAVDFDGTVVAHRYPEIGKDIGAVDTLKELVEKGHRLILHTMRCDEELQAAVKWFDERGVKLWGINKSPGQTRWTSSPKIFAHLYIDDTALGVPLINDPSESSPYVDWTKVRELLIEKKIL